MTENQISLRLQNKVTAISQGKQTTKAQCDGLLSQIFLRAMEYHQWPFNADNILEWALRKIEFVNSVLKRKKKGFLFLNPISIFFLINFFIQITKQILIVFSEILIILALLGRIYCFVGGNISFSEAYIINDAIFLSQYVYIINNLDMKLHHHSLFLSLSFLKYSTSEKK